MRDAKFEEPERLLLHPAACEKLQKITTIQQKPDNFEHFLRPTSIFTSKTSRQLHCQSWYLTTYLQPGNSIANLFFYRTSTLQSRSRRASSAAESYWPTFKGFYSLIGALVKSNSLSAMTKQTASPHSKPTNFCTFTTFFTPIRASVTCLEERYMPGGASHAWDDTCLGERHSLGDVTRLITRFGFTAALVSSIPTLTRYFLTLLVSPFPPLR